MARAYVDQLERSKGLSADRITAVRKALADAEAQSGAARGGTLTQLAQQLGGDAGGSSDRARVEKLAAAVRDLAK